jgi:hypothetical protein
VSREDVETDFPGLIGKDYDLSEEDFDNNCLGFVLGDFRNWWEPPKTNHQYWPPGFDEDVTVATVEKILRLHGYTVEGLKKNNLKRMRLLSLRKETNGLISRSFLRAYGVANSARGMMSPV